MHCGLLSFLLIPPLFSLSSLYRLLSVLLSFPFKSPSLLSSLNFFSLSLFLLLSPFPLLHSSSPPLISCPLVHHPPTLHLVLRPCILLLPFRYSCLSTRCFPLPPSISVFSAVRAAGGSLATSIVSVLCVCVCVLKWERFANIPYCLPEVLWRRHIHTQLTMIRSLHYSITRTHMLYLRASYCWKCDIWPKRLLVHSYSLLVVIISN